MQHCRLLWIALGLLALAAAGCSAPAQAGTLPVQSSVNVPPVQLSGSTATATGRVVLAQRVNLSFALSGQVVEMAVEEGDTVQAGQLIARLDTTVLDAEVARAEAELAVLQADLAKVQAGVHEARIREAESQVIAVANDLLLSTRQRAAEQAAAQARLDYLLAQPLAEDVVLAQARVREAEALVALAQARRNQSALMAPIAGTVTRVFVHQYEYAAAGQTVIQIGDTGHLRIEATDMAEADLVRIKEGDSAAVTFEALPGVEVPGVVAAIWPSAERAGSFVVAIEVQRFPEGIRPGMTAYIDILLR